MTGEKTLSQKQFFLYNILCGCRTFRTRTFRTRIFCTRTIRTRTFRTQPRTFRTQNLKLQFLLCSNVCLPCAKVFLCQLTCQSADIMSSLCGVGVRVRVNNFFSKTTRPRDMLFFLKDTLSIEDEKLFKACKSVCSSVC